MSSIGAAFEIEPQLKTIEKINDKARVNVKGENKRFT